ncbi:hypothetical protein NMG60_11031865 [Bertholletia excelsa]
MSFLEEFQTNLESLPRTLQRKYTLLRDLDKSLQEIQWQNELRCSQEMDKIQQGIKSGNIAPDASNIRFSDEALDEQKHAIRIADEKVALAVQAYDLVDAHVQQLDQYLKKIDEELRHAEMTGSPAQNLERTVKSGRGGGRGRGNKNRLMTVSAAVTPTSLDLDLPVDPNEPTYCFCNQVSYGEMVACDNPDCKIEWFHYGCVGLREQPKGKWYCSECAGKRRGRKAK